jgi:hypothetical protein
MLITIMEAPKLARRHNKRAFTGVVCVGLVVAFAVSWGYDIFTAYLIYLVNLGVETIEYISRPVFDPVMVIGTLVILAVVLGA